MSQRTKRIILAVAIVQLILIVIVLALPNVVLAIPGRYRVALSERNAFLGNLTEGLIERVAPFSDTLPTPEFVGEKPKITIPVFEPTEILPTRAIETDLESNQPPSVESGTAQSANESQVVTAQSEPTSTPEPSPTPTIAPTLAPPPLQVKLTGIKRIQQNFNNCGPANLTQVLNWYKNETSQSEAASYLKPNPEDRNVSPWQLSDYVNEFTELKSTVHSNGNLEMLKQFLAAGFPVVIEKGYEPNTESSPGWFGHYLTVFGYDDEKQLFYSMDTYLKVDEINGRADSYEEIEHYWQHFNYSFYVVYEPDREAEVFAILGPDMLQPFTMWENAAKRAQAEIELEPDNAFAWFNLGTSLTRMGELTGNGEYYQNGAAAFDQARAIGLPPRMLWYEFRPYLAYMKVSRYEDMVELANAITESQGGRNVEETYLYLGHALLFQGDVAGATAAYQRALELNQNFYPAEIALESLG